MADWLALFDQCKTVVGASDDDVLKLAAKVSRPLPEAYLEFLRYSNGGEFRKGERWFQFFPALDPARGPLATRDAHKLGDYMPDALPFATNGGGTLYLFDMRRPAVNGEYPISCTRADNPAWSPGSRVQIANTFLNALRGTTDVDSLFLGM